MATNFFLIGYHFEEFRSLEAIRKKKLISHPVHVHLVIPAGWMYETQDETLQFTNLIMAQDQLGSHFHTQFWSLTTIEPDICGMKILPGFNF